MIALNSAITGLRVAEQNLYVTSNNLSNVETDGYHRQRLNQVSFQTVSRGHLTVGLGVDADRVNHVRLEFLETNYRNELASYGEFKYEDKAYTSLQSIIGDNGSYINDTLKDMWESFNELAKEYTTTVAGPYLRENAVSLITEFNGINEQLDKMQLELDNEIPIEINKINSYSEKIAKLNDKITRMEANGSKACELRDSRDSLIAELSKLVDVTVENATETCVNIRSANGYLVVRTEFNALDVEKNIPGSIFRMPVWAETRENFEVNSGELKGILDMRGGDAIGNMVHSSNGAPKEKMDIVISIDNNMDFKTLQKTVTNFNNMLDMFDRQSVNYQLYLTNGKAVNGKDLANFVDHLYAEAAKLEINNFSSTKISDLQNEIKGLYGKDSQLDSDIWGYLETKGLDFNGFETFLDGQTIDAEKLAKMKSIISDYNSNGKGTLSGLSKYLTDEKLGVEAEELQGYLADYVDTVPLDKNEINSYIDNKYNTNLADTNMLEIKDAQTDNVLNGVKRATFTNFRDDSNRFMMVFTDDAITNSVTKENTVALMKEANMSMIAVATDDVKKDWEYIAEETDGDVFNIDELKNTDTAEKLGVSITRNFNSKLNGVDTENGIAFFRAGLNSLLNGLVREVNGVLRQGENGYHHRHGDPVLDENGNQVVDPITGEPKTYNLDLFIKVNDNLPLQMGNIKINPEYDDVMNMPLSLTGNTGDFQIGNMLVDLTRADVFNSKDSSSTFDEHYANFILDFGQAANRAFTGLETQNTVLDVAKSRLNQISSVSMDEELSNMVRFQHSYTAASKMIRVVDEMLETVINI